MTAADAIPEDLADDHRRRLAEELAPDERLLWAEAGRPKPFRPGAWFATFGLIALILLGFCAFGLATGLGWIGQVTDRESPLVTSFFSGLLASGIVLGMAAYRTLKRDEAARAARSLYALTDRRAILWVPVPGWTGGIAVHSLGRGRVAKVHRVEYPDGSGDVILTTRVTRPPLNPEAANAVETFLFKDVAKVRHIEELARGTVLGPEPESVI